MRFPVFHTVLLLFVSCIEHPPSPEPETYDLFHSDSIYKVSKIVLELEQGNMDNYQWEILYKNDTISSTSSNFQTIATFYSWNDFGQLDKINLGSDGFVNKYLYENSLLIKMRYQWSVFMGNGSEEHSYYDYEENQITITDSLVWVSYQNRPSTFLRKHILTFDQKGNVIKIEATTADSFQWFEFTFDDAYSPLSEFIYCTLTLDENGFFAAYPLNLPLSKNNILQEKVFNSDSVLVLEKMHDISYSEDGRYPLTYDQYDFEYVATSAK